MAKTIHVRAAGSDNKVVLWEKDDAHPNGEVVVANDGKMHKVGETAAVKRLMAAGTLVNTQTTPTSQQTPPTQTQGGAPKPPLTPPPGPLAGLGLTAEQENALTEAGFADRARLGAASDDDLLAIPTIGKATVENLRKALK